MDLPTSNTGYARLSDPAENQTFDNLIGDRQVLVKRLTSLIQNTYTPYVIGLNSEWGTGKTFFLNAWQNYLRKEKPEAMCVYFNAWKNDYSGDPLANLMAIVEEQVVDPEEKVKKQFANSARDLVAVGSKLFKWCGPIMAASGNPIGGAVAGAIGKAGEWVTKQIKEANAAAKDFCDKLNNFSTEVRKNTNFPLFIMVDELDRCRPDYAIELLERIKHLFNVENVIFILAIDGNQILQQVEHTFGLKPYSNNPTENKQIHNIGTTSDTRLNYLNKFIDIFYQLPDPNRQEFVRMKLKKMPEMKKYCEKFSNALFLQLGLINVLTGDITLLGNKSLRDLIQNIELFSVFLRMENDLCFEELFTAFLIIMRNKNRMASFQDISQDLKIKYDLNKISRGVYNGNILNINNDEIINDVQGFFHLDHPESVAHFWICMKMLYPDISAGSKDFEVFFTSVRNSMLMGIAYTEQTSPQAIPPLILKNMATVEEPLVKKLQLIDDFSQTIPSKSLDMVFPDLDYYG